MYNSSKPCFIITAILVVEMKRKDYGTIFIRWSIWDYFFPWLNNNSFSCFERFS